ESATTSVNWKRLRLAADELFTVPDPGNPPTAFLFVMDADGTNLRQITKTIPTAGGMSHASPDWPPNGDLIAFDAWSGRAETSHTFTVKPDGTGLKDLGVAAMPTFSADGKRLAFT
ncbi:MAG: TolB family protein, partial [Planctomycetales bacterium]